MHLLQKSMTLFSDIFHDHDYDDLFSSSLSPPSFGNVDISFNLFIHWQYSFEPASAIFSASFFSVFFLLLNKYNLFDCVRRGRGYWWVHVYPSPLNNFNFKSLRVCNIFSFKKCFCTSLMFFSSLYSFMKKYRILCIFTTTGSRTCFHCIFCFVCISQ